MTLNEFMHSAKTGRAFGWHQFKKWNMRVTAASFLAVASVSQADAATFRITYKGTIANGYDVTGLFGAASTDLAGQTFEAAYTLTDPKPGAYVDSTPRYRFIAGGTIRGYLSPLNGQITINGSTEIVRGLQLGEVYHAYRNGAFDEVSHKVLERDNLRNSSIFSYIHSSVNQFLTSTDPTAPLNYQLQAGDRSGGQFYIYKSGVLAGGGSAYGTLIPQSVTIVPTNQIASAVPEPASWAMMIFGFGAVGTAVRRRANGMHMKLR